MEQQQNLFGEGEGDLRVVASFGDVPHEGLLRQAA
jgi:hypothetical protein